jgi:superfamily II helicase
MKKEMYEMCPKCVQDKRQSLDDYKKMIRQGDKMVCQTCVAEWTPPKGFFKEEEK